MGTTSLHWAIHQQSELATLYILAWLEREHLGMQDEDGNTPMHLAILASNQLENSRLIRLLLFNGAPTDIRNAKGQLPVDLVPEIESPKLKLEILKLFEQRQTLR